MRPAFVPAALRARAAQIDAHCACGAHPTYDEHGNRETCSPCENNTYILGMAADIYEQTNKRFASAERDRRHALPDPTHITHQQLLDAHTVLGLSTKGGQETVITYREVRYTRFVKGPDGVTLLKPGTTDELLHETLVIPIVDEAP